MIVLAGLSTCLGFLMMPDSPEGLDETDGIPATADTSNSAGFGAEGCVSAHKSFMRRSDSTMI
jgi:hypothetical protein